MSHPDVGTRPLTDFTTAWTTFVELGARGYWVVAIYPCGTPRKAGPAAGKEPIGNRWGLERWSTKRATDTFRQWPRSGVGVCLGPGRAPGGGWLADVEGDGAQAE